MDNVNSNGLWKSGVLKYDWDDLVTTAFVLSYLAPFNDVSIPEWDKCVIAALDNMISKARSDEFWKRTTDDKLQWFRVESRIAAAIAIVLRKRCVPLHVRDGSNYYLSGWRNRWEDFANNLQEDKWDLSTALFILDALYSREELREFVTKEGIVKGSSTDVKEWHK
jgi:hypothetical protein